ncbi:hypothetical protein FRC17_007492 [Serendipita sp. 399]|nr:hypothetical protein FRC17_007492 [Serendipita sp. 399]
MFSGFYDALNKGAAAVLPDVATNPIPRPVSATPRTSLGPDPASPPSSTGNGGELGYSTYQRRPKATLEDRLRASLAAKESRRASQERGVSPTPDVTQGSNTLPLSISPVENKESLPIVHPDPASLPLPVSPPTVPMEHPLPQRTLSVTLEEPSPMQAREPPVSTMSIPPLSDDTIAQPLVRQESEAPRMKQADPLSPLPVALPDNGPLEQLVKAEKDRDDFQKELSVLKENGVAEERKGNEEVKSLRLEVERANNELDRVREDGLREIERIKEETRREFERRRAQLEAEVAAMQDGMEREMLARRGEWEIEGMAAKTAHQKEVTALNARISALNTSLSQLTGEKGQLFSDVQTRQSELEASRTELEDIRAQMTDLEYQLKEKEEQLSMMKVEIAESRRTVTSSTNRSGRSSSGPSSAEIARLLAEAESRSEARVAELRSRLKNIESERAEQEESWSRTLAARGEEIDRLRGLLNLKETEGRQAGDYKARRDKDVEELEERIQAMEREKLEETRRHRHLFGELEVLKEGWESRGFEIVELNGRVETLNGQLEELRAKEAQLKVNNKTLRDELRKVQSSAALLERQRNPGFGYWASSNPRAPNTGFVYGETTGASSSNVDLSRSTSNGRPGTPVSAGTPKQDVDGVVRASSPGSARSSIEATTGGAQGEEDVSLEYLRNVVLQFLENEKMRPSLVRVISVILKFTPQETRRLMAKV